MASNSDSFKVNTLATRSASSGTHSVPRTLFVASRVIPTQPLTPGSAASVTSQENPAHKLLPASICNLLFRLLCSRLSNSGISETSAARVPPNALTKPNSSKLSPHPRSAYLWNSCAPSSAPPAPARRVTLLPNFASRVSSASKVSSSESAARKYSAIISFFAVWLSITAKASSSSSSSDINPSTTHCSASSSWLNKSRPGHKPSSF
mmetsp:Transcript_13306/g.49758  ORF Transcript_13306/g.49758 Transcript_13306/m.49758 type:complete len:207 (-) Transcript_13306:1257-1877(-)